MKTLAFIFFGFAFISIICCAMILISIFFLLFLVFLLLKDTFYIIRRWFSDNFGISEEKRQINKLISRILLDPETPEEIDKLLDSYDIRPLTEKELQKRVNRLKDIMDFNQIDIKKHSCECKKPL